MTDSRDRRQLKIDLSELETAFDNSFFELSYFLDLETGDVLLVTEDDRQALEKVNETIEGDAAGEPDDAFNDALDRSTIPDWERDAVRVAAMIDADDAARFLAVPPADSNEAYRDMERFIATVDDERLQERLRAAVDGQRPFRRFKDELYEHPDERQRWFEFRDARLRRRVLDWLDEEGIDPINE